MSLGWCSTTPNLTVNGGSLYLAIFNHGSPGNGDSILQFSPLLFEGWISAPAFNLDPAEQGFAMDPDGDNLANGIEAWFGTRPDEVSSGLAGFSRGGLSSIFTHPQNDEPPGDLIAFCQWSPNLDDDAAFFRFSVE